MQKSFRVGIIPGSYFAPRQKIEGSSWLRAYQLAGVSPNYMLWEHGMDYDALIFQKAYWPEMMDLFKGPKILDLCDPDWYRENVDIISLGNKVQAVTCSSAALTDLVAQYFPDKPVVCVPDRLDLTSFPPSRPLHRGRAKHAVWFGYIHNAHETLPSMASMLEQSRLRLTIISNAPYEQNDAIAALHPLYVPYDSKRLFYHLRHADMVLNPRSDRAYFRYKSLNKSLISWQMGVPVAVEPSDIECLMDADARNREVACRQRIVAREYDIQQTVVQYNHVFEDIIAQMRITDVSK